MRLESVANPKHTAYLHAQVSSRIVNLTNQLSTTVEATLRAGSSDRYTIHPQQVRLKPGQTSEVEIKLKVVRFAQIDKAVEHGQRDTFHIKTPFFDQRFTATFFLSKQVLSATQGPASCAYHAKRALQDASDAKAADAATSATRQHQRPQHQSQADQGASQHAQPQAFSFRLPASPEALPARDGRTDRTVCLDAPCCTHLNLSVPCRSHNAMCKLHNQPKCAHLQGLSQIDCDQAVHQAVQQALRKERDTQEARNSRVLEILHAKDAAIAEGQAAEQELQAKVPS